MHEYSGANLALRRAIAEMNSARPHAPVVDDRPGRRRAVRVRARSGLWSRTGRSRAALASALRATAARLDPPCATPQTAPQVLVRAPGGAV